MDKTNIVKAVGVDKSHFDHILAGRRNPSRKLALRLEKATGIPRMVWLYGTTVEIRARLEHFFTYGKTDQGGFPS